MYAVTTPFADKAAESTCPRRAVEISEGPMDQLPGLGAGYGLGLGLVRSDLTGRAYIFIAPSRRDVILADDPSVLQPGRCEDRCVSGGGRPVEWPAVRREKAMRHLMLSEPWECGPPWSPAARATLLGLDAWWIATEEPPAVDPDEGCLTGDSAGTDRGGVCPVDAEFQVGHHLSDLYTPFAGREARVVDPGGLVPQHVLQGIECVSAYALAARRER